MNKLVAISAVVLTAGVITGCATTREDYAKEYERLAALPPAQPVMSPNQAITGCARFSADLSNEVHPMMRAYVTSVENCREYTGFMNDVQAVKDAEGLTNEAAAKKVADEVIASDKGKPADQQVWPKIVNGIAAANHLDPKKQLVKIAALVLRNKNIGNDVAKLPDAYKNEDFMGKAKRAAECAKISEQLAETSKCLVYLGDQYERVLALEHFGE